MPVIQSSDQGHQFDAGFRKDQRVERTRFVLSQEDGSDSTTTPEGLRRLGNEARRLARLGTRLLCLCAFIRCAGWRGSPLQASERGHSEIRQQVCHLGIEGANDEWNQSRRYFRPVCLPVCDHIASDGQAKRLAFIGQRLLWLVRIAAQRRQPLTKVDEFRFHTLTLTRRFVASLTSCASEFFSSMFSAGSASAWLGA